MTSVWLISVGLLFTALLGWRRVFHLKRDMLQMEKAANSSLANQQYNELISEVATLITEKVGQEKLRNELATASAMQETLLPEESTFYEEIAVSGRVIMAGGCGGDWWYHCQVGAYVCLWIGDVTGHGVSSALVASACRAVVGALENLAVTDPAQAMASLNQVLFPMLKSKLSVTAICVRIHARSGRVDLVNASHPSLFHLKSNFGMSCVLNEPLHPALGVEANYQYTSTSLQLERDDILIMLTDGLLDFPTAAQAIWSQKRLLAFVKAAAEEQRSASYVTHQLQAQIVKKGQGSAEDDVTFLAIHRKAS